MPAKKAAVRASRKYDAMPDRVDIRDWVYQPTLAPLPSLLVNCHEIPEEGILDQGSEGACTGYALAAVINFLLRRNERAINATVSPHMLYYLARRYDEWPGEDYEGSSARGAMKGWLRHGVCGTKSWKRGNKIITDKIAQESMQFPGGAFYRVTHRQVRDMHSALSETGILYCTLMVHAGWDDPAGDPVEVHYRDRHGKNHTISLPVIVRKGRADGGHAIAIVGYTEQGFIIQNSWGTDWGTGGFALLPYEDYLMHATDVWVAQLGVPVNTDLWVAKSWADRTSGIGRVQEAINLNRIRPYIIDVGNNGELSDSGDYWTTEEDIVQLFKKTIPSRTKGWKKKRLLLYLHGGLNDEKAVARRVVSFQDVMLDNQIYPVHIMWETGVMESIGGIITDFFTDVDDRAGSVGDWFQKFRDGLVEAKDKTFEVTVAKIGTALWDEMKENARLASTRRNNKGAMQIVQRIAQEVLEPIKSKVQDSWEIHVVGHSAGSIFIGYALKILVNIGIPLKTIQLMAPAITYEAFKELYMPHIRGKRSPVPTMYLLGDDAEKRDTVGPYGKSLLYLVSNAFEGRRETPILGMERFLDNTAWDPDNHYKSVVGLYANGSTVDGRPTLVVSDIGHQHNDGADSTGDISGSTTHGDFDNDAATMNSVLWRILGAQPARLFTSRDLA